MSIVHELKCWPEYFRPVQRGEKPFEIRRNDRDYQVGDVLVLWEWCPDRQAYTGESVVRRISYMTDFAQQPHHVVLGLEQTDLRERLALYEKTLRRIAGHTILLPDAARYYEQAYKLLRDEACSVLRG